MAALRFHREYLNTPTPPGPRILATHYSMPALPHPPALCEVRVAGRGGGGVSNICA